MQLKPALCTVLHLLQALVLSHRTSGFIYRQHAVHVLMCRYIHDLVTFARVSGVQYLGRPETEHSWFPGYAW